MNFVTLSADELLDLRADPLLFEQTLDAKPSVARALERALGFRAGRSYWKSNSGHLYGIDLGDFGRGFPSMAIVYGFWPAFEPRPLDDNEIDEDLSELCLWVSNICDDMDPDIMAAVLDFAKATRSDGGELKVPL